MVYEVIPTYGWSFCQAYSGINGHKATQESLQNKHPLAPCWWLNQPYLKKMCKSIWIISPHKYEHKQIIETTTQLCMDGPFVKWATVKNPAGYFPWDFHETSWLFSIGILIL